MNVGELIAELRRLPRGAEVWHLWDGKARTVINHVWLSRDGVVVTADDDHVCYSVGTRPIDACDDGYWSTPMKRVPKQRWARRAYNAYMRMYMAVRRAVLAGRAEYWPRRKGT